MRAGRPSNTAQYLAFIRALGDRSPDVPGFSDPVAVNLLGPRWARIVARAGGGRRRSPFPWWVSRGMAMFNEYRTVVIDRAVTEGPVSQVVILGAGLDARAYRLDALQGATVFEVDHPGTQEIKRAAVVALRPLARDVRHVGVDFGKDDLSTALLACGFDAYLPTLWLWEGVTMYLEHADIVQTLRVMAALSVPGSRAVVSYLATSERGPVRRAFLALFGALTGEPLRTTFAKDELGVLASQSGWRVASTSGLEDWMAADPPSAPMSPRDAGVQQDERVAVFEVAR